MARVYRYAPTNLAAIVRLSDVTVSSGTSVTWAPQSITMLVLPGAAGPQPTPDLDLHRDDRCRRARPAPPPRRRRRSSNSRAASVPPAASRSRASPSRFRRTGQSATTGASGTYAFAAAPGVPLQVAPRRSAGTGAAVSALDAAWVLQAIAGTRTLTPTQRLAADVTGDGTLSTLDAAYILQHAVG